MKSTMQDAPLSISRLLEHAARVHPDTEVVTATPDGTRRRTFRRGRRAGRPPGRGVARTCGIDGDQRVGHVHVEQRRAPRGRTSPCPSMGAVLHTLNIRLFPDQVTYVANHAEDKVVVVDASLLPPFAALLPTFETVTPRAGRRTRGGRRRPVLARGDGQDDPPLRGRTAQPPNRVTEWPDIVETDAAAMCYTSGTTGNPKGVAYSHRSMYLHSMARRDGRRDGADAVRPDPADRADVPRQRLGPAVRRVHGPAPRMVMPDRLLQSEPLTRLIAGERATVSGAVPTIWNDILTYARRARGRPLVASGSSPCGGSAVPVGAACGRFDERHGVKVLQAWGMTETSRRSRRSRCRPSGSTRAATRAGATAPPRAASLAGVTARIVGDDGQELPRDGVAVGEIEVRGPWVTASYYKDDDPDPEKFRDGWLRTGDVGTLRPARLHHPHRPGQGRHQVRRRVDLLGRPGERT